MLFFPNQYKETLVEYEINSAITNRNLKYSKPCITAKITAPVRDVSNVAGMTMLKIIEFSSFWCMERKSAAGRYIV